MRPGSGGDPLPAPQSSPAHCVLVWAQSHSGEPHPQDLSPPQAPPPHTGTFEAEDWSMWLRGDAHAGIEAGPISGTVNVTYEEKDSSQI